MNHLIQISLDKILYLRQDEAQAFLEHWLGLIHGSFFDKKMFYNLVIDKYVPVPVAKKVVHKDEDDNEDQGGDEERERNPFLSTKLSHTDPTIQITPQIHSIDLIYEYPLHSTPRLILMQPYRVWNLCSMSLAVNDHDCVCRQCVRLVKHPNWTPHMWLWLFLQRLTETPQLWMVREEQCNFFFQIEQEHIDSRDPR